MTNHLTVSLASAAELAAVTRARRDIGLPEVMPTPARIRAAMTFTGLALAGFAQARQRAKAHLAGPLRRAPTTP